ncbi:MAG: hypothetical protein II821_08360 [Treponema sp.]|nr:hypothetical protein [Treponema sp.]
MKKIVKTAIIMLFSTPLFAADFFSGEAGLMANFENQEKFKFDPTLCFDGFLSGQIALSNALSVRGEFSIRTSDLLEDGIMQEVDSIFRINELSATFTKSFGGFNHTLSAFKGCFESIGSGQFIQRHLGVKPYGSFLTNSFLGLNGIYAYDLYGTGGSYTITSKRLPLAMGLVISKTPEDQSPEDEICPLLNTDLRFAYYNSVLMIDALAGITAPLRTTNDSGEDVVLLIDTLYFHTGIDLHLLSPYSPVSFLFQAGVEYFPLKKTSKAVTFQNDSVYLLEETRLNSGTAKCYITVFHIPEELGNLKVSKIGKSVFIEEPLGANIRFFGEKLHTKNREYDAGLNVMAGLKGIHFSNINDLDLNKDLNIKIIPFTEIDVNNGRLTAALQVSITEFANNEDEGSALKLHLGYKKEL